MTMQETYTENFEDFDDIDDYEAESFDDDDDVFDDSLSEFLPRVLDPLGVSKIATSFIPKSFTSGIGGRSPKGSVRTRNGRRARFSVPDAASKKQVKKIANRIRKEMAKQNAKIVALDNEIKENANNMTMMTLFGNSMSPMMKIMMMGGFGDDLFENPMMLVMAMGGGSDLFGGSS